MPKIVLLSSRVNKEAQLKRYEQCGIKMLIKKPLQTEDILRVFRKCNYEYKEHTV